MSTIKRNLFFFGIILQFHMIAQDKLVYVDTEKWEPGNVNIIGNNNVVYTGDNITLNRVEIPLEALAKIEEKYKLELGILRNKVLSQQIKVQDLNKEIAKLQVNTTTAITQAQQLSARFQTIDFEQSSSLFKKAYQTFLSGDFPQTLALLSSAQLENQDRKNADNRKFKANLLAIQYEFLKARQEFERSCEIFENFGNYFDYANFLLSQTDYINAEALFKKSLDFFELKLQKALVSTNLGIISRALGQPQRAIEFHETAVNLLVEVLKEQPEYVGQIGSALNNIGNALTDLGHVQSAKIALENALKIRSELVKIDPDAFESDLATTLLNLGYLYRNRQNIDTALIYYMQALPLRRKLVKKDSSLMQRAALALLLSNIGDVLQENAAFPQARTYYNEAIKIYQGLAKINPDVYNIEIAHLSINVGYLLFETQKHKEAIAKFESAKKIYQSLDSANFQNIERYIGIAIHNQGLCYYSITDLSKALTYFNDAIKIRKKIVKPDNVNSIADLGQSFNCLGNVLTDQKKWEEAIKAYEEAFLLRKQAARHSPLVYSLDMTETLINKGGLYLSLWVESTRETFRTIGLQSLNDALAILKYFPQSPWAQKQKQQAELKINFFNK